jgi:hypothetical protein
MMAKRKRADPYPFLEGVSDELRHEMRDVYPPVAATKKGRSGRKRAASREEHFAPRMFFAGTPHVVPDKDELLRALEVARERFIESGYDLPKRLRDELLRLLRAWDRRMDALIICSRVAEFARSGLPVAKSARAGRESAFEAAARDLNDKYGRRLTPENVERIYRQTITASRERKRTLPGGKT